MQSICTRARDRSSGRKDEPAVGPARASIGIAMANRRSSRCDCRWCIETEEAAQSLRRTASRCSAPANPSGGIFPEPATRPLLPMAVGLPRNDRSLNPRQKLLRFGQGQSQVRNIAKTFRPADLYQIGAQATGVIPRRNQPQHPSHPRSPGRLSTRPIVPPVSSYPHSLMWTAPSLATSLLGGSTFLSWFLCSSHINALRCGKR